MSFSGSVNMGSASPQRAVAVDRANRFKHFSGRLVALVFYTIVWITIAKDGGSACTT
jgi:hypothetical protein|tara:strand:+ start:141 stop:311 length:171 start_codon:yes stop_codon:yes gene_type:complete